MAPMVRYGCNVLRCILRNSYSNSLVLNMNDSVHMLHYPPFQEAPYDQSSKQGWSSSMLDSLCSLDHALQASGLRNRLSPVATLPADPIGCHPFRRSSRHSVSKVTRTEFNCSHCNCCGGRGNGYCSVRERLRQLCLFSKEQKVTK